MVVSLGEIVVEGASRGPERIVEAPAAISVVPQEVLQNAAITGQAPMALQTCPGVDVVQSGVNDFNVNARGFNSTLNRRVLVLQDGRDLSIAFLGAQEWNGMTQPLDDLGKRGDGAGARLGALRRQRLQRRHQHHHARGARGGRHQVDHRGWRAGDIPRRTSATPASSADGRFGLRLNGGYNQSDTYSRSRTLADGTSLQQEYEDATDEPVPLTGERLPLNGQTADSVTGEISGDRDPLKNIYGSGRLDYYLTTGRWSPRTAAPPRWRTRSSSPASAGCKWTRRSSPTPAPRWPPSATTSSATGTAGRRSSPSSPSPRVCRIEERSDIFHLEGQNNWNFNQERGRVVYGASYRNTMVNTSGTLMNPVNDDRSDALYSAYGQVEYRITPEVAAGGGGTIRRRRPVRGQFSPKGAVVFSPDENHSFRFSVNRAFQTPNYSEFFLQVPVQAPTPVPRPSKARSRPTTPPSSLHRCHRAPSRA